MRRRKRKENNFFVLVFKKNLILLFRILNNWLDRLNKWIEKDIKDASKVLGINDKKLIDRAIIVYLDAIQKQIDLKREMKLWDELSNEALINFEKSL